MESKAHRLEWKTDDVNGYSIDMPEPGAPNYWKELESKLAHLLCYVAKQGFMGEEETTIDHVTVVLDPIDLDALFEEAK